MGLDNGIRIKGMPEKDIKKIPYVNSDTGFFKGEETVEIVYWRKCWGIRRVIMGVLHMKDLDYDHTVDPDDIPAIIRQLKPFLNESFWDENADSIFTYEEYFETLYEQIIRLEWFKEYYKEHPNLEVTFYDSY